MKKLTDANASDAPRSKGPFDMRSLPQQGSDAAKKGLGPRFKKVGGAAAATGGSRFKKIGEEAKPNAEKDARPKAVEVETQKEVVLAADMEAKIQAEAPKDEDVVMADDEEDEAITWDEYDVTKPSDCEHAGCSGCAPPANPRYENGWLVLGSA